jgi:GT2 family glycosyltransferase
VNIHNCEGDLPKVESKGLIHTMQTTSTNLGLVVIGRNEGERLRQCLASVLPQVKYVVYVDSNSSDNSVTLAKSLGVDVVVLDSAQPLSAARARNAGFEYLDKTYDNLRYIQFLDGDCELAEGWIAAAVTKLDTDPEIAIVCGRRRERYPEATIYNKLCDIEWNTPVGEATACGGDFMIRPEAFWQVGGFDITLIAGEEPEMCVRLRRKGWKIFRIDADMSIHDANMHRLGQWWTRSRRGGHAFAEGAWMHGLSPQRHWLRESLRNWVWGMVLPMIALVLAWPTQGLSLLLLLLYPASFLKSLYSNYESGQLNFKDSAAYAFFCVLIKFPMVLGQLQFMLSKLSGQKTRLVEYKNSIDL